MQSLSDICKKVIITRFIPVLTLCFLLVLSTTLSGCVVSPQEQSSSSGNSQSPGSSPRAGYIIISDNFDQGVLDSSRWQTTHDGDFAEMTVDVYNTGRAGQADYRLRMKANTIGTSDETVKFLGIRSKQKIGFTEPKSISFDLDWNNQANGCYLTAGIYLCPTFTDKNPGSEPDWIALEYIGVPPGENARLQAARMRKGNLQLPFTEGWPDQQRTGRKIANQHLELIIDSGSFKVKENGTELFSSANQDIDFTQAYLYLQMSSHSNYPSREVYFDDVMVKELSHK